LVTSSEIPMETNPFDSVPPEPETYEMVVKLPLDMFWPFVNKHDTYEGSAAAVAYIPPNTLEFPYNLLGETK
jgi:hypothetical protein